MMFSRGWRLNCYWCDRIIFLALPGESALLSLLFFMYGRLISFSVGFQPCYAEMLGGILSNIVVVDMTSDRAALSGSRCLVQCRCRQDVEAMMWSSFVYGIFKSVVFQIR